MVGGIGNRPWQKTLTMLRCYWAQELQPSLLPPNPEQGRTKKKRGGVTAKRSRIWACGKGGEEEDRVSLAVATTLGLGSLPVLRGAQEKRAVAMQWSRRVGGDWRKRDRRVAIALKGKKSPLRLWTWRRPSLRRPLPTLLRSLASGSLPRVLPPSLPWSIERLFALIASSQGITFPKR